MPTSKGLGLTLVRLAVFAAAFYMVGWVSSGLIYWIAGGLAAPTFSILLSSLCATWLAMRIYESRPVADAGGRWQAGSAVNLGWGLLGGCAAAALALGLPLLSGASYIVRSHAPSGQGIVFAVLCLAAGAAGEEILFRGYGLQTLMARVGPWAAVLPVGALFGLLHAGNPGSSPLGLVNTAAFGILFGYAFLRTHDLWLPIGLHFGWNLTLPMFGADLSGLNIFKEITGHELLWRAGPLWSGGSYGPEASLITSAVLLPLAYFVYKAPVRRQSAPLVDLPAEELCDATPQSPLS